MPRWHCPYAGRTIHARRTSRPASRRSDLFDLRHGNGYCVFDILHKHEQGNAVVFRCTDLADSTMSSRTSIRGSGLVRHVLRMFACNCHARWFFPGEQVLLVDLGPPLAGNSVARDERRHSTCTVVACCILRRHSRYGDRGTSQKYSSERASIDVSVRDAVYSTSGKARVGDCAQAAPQARVGLISYLSTTRIPPRPQSPTRRTPNA